MATDPLDPGTDQLLKRPRGRPVTGEAKTDAVRAREYRRRLRSRGTKASNQPGEASTAVLLKELGYLCSKACTWDGRAAGIHRILGELARRFPAHKV